MDEWVKFIARMLDGEKMAAVCRDFIRLTPQQRRKSGHRTRSESGQFRTHAPPQIYNKPWPVLQGPATIAKLASTALLSSKAVEQPVPAGAAEVALAATAIGPARGMR